MPFGTVGHKIAACADGQFVQTDRVQYVPVAVHHKHGGIIAVVVVNGIQSDKERVFADRDGIRNSHETLYVEVNRIDDAVGSAVVNNQFFVG